jgi:hypothetical protein
VCVGCVYISVHICTSRLVNQDCGDSIEGKVVNDVDELKGSDCGNATEETEKDGKVEKSDYVDEATNDMDKLRLSKNRQRSCLNMMQAEKQSPRVQ